MALHALLYPFSWEHVFVPMTSQQLGSDLANCPTPFLIGSLVSEESKYRPDVSECDQVLIVDLDRNGAFVKSIGDERKLLPDRYFAALKKLLFDRKDLKKSATVDSATSSGAAEYISECFLHLLVQLLYQMDNYVINDPTDPLAPHFQVHKYLQLRSKDLRDFLKKFTCTILFARFLQQRYPLDPNSRFNSRMREYHLYREASARTTSRRGPKLFKTFANRRKSVVNFSNSNTNSNSSKIETRETVS